MKAKAKKIFDNKRMAVCVIAAMISEAALDADIPSICPWDSPAAQKKRRDFYATYHKAGKRIDTRWKFMPKQELRPIIVFYGSHGTFFTGCTKEDINGKYESFSFTLMEEYLYFSTNEVYTYSSPNFHANVIKHLNFIMKIVKANT